MLLNVGKAKFNEGESQNFEVSFPLREDLLSNRGLTPASEVNVKGEFYYKFGILYLSANVKVSLSGVCDKCGKPVEKFLNFDMKEQFVESSDSTSNEDYTINQVSIDLSRPVEDNLLYAIPSRILCKDSCKGLCSICGKDKNEFSCNCEAIAMDEQKQEQNPFSKLKK